jgi:hypothetical protein
MSGGGRGIRTPGTVSRTVVFKTTAIDHSAIPPSPNFHIFPRRNVCPDITRRSRNYDVCPQRRDNVGTKYSPWFAQSTKFQPMFAVYQRHLKGCAEYINTLVPTTSYGQCSPVPPPRFPSWEANLRRIPGRGKSRCGASVCRDYTLRSPSFPTRLMLPAHSWRHRLYWVE